MRRRLVSAVVLSCTILPAAAIGQGRPGAPGGMAVQSLAADASFVLNAADHDARRVEAARVAATRASDAQVKAFAERMVRDHNRASTELMTLARARSIPVKSDPAVATLAANTFAGLSGARFDMAYIGQAVKDHEATVALFEDESRSGKDAELKAWAARTLPMLREHLRVARDLAKP